MSIRQALFEGTQPITHVEFADAVVEGEVGPMMMDQGLSGWTLKIMKALLRHDMVAHGVLREKEDPEVDFLCLPLRERLLRVKPPYFDHLTAGEYEDDAKDSASALIRQLISGEVPMPPELPPKIVNELSKTHPTWVDVNVNPQVPEGDLMHSPSLRRRALELLRVV